MGRRLRGSVCAAGLALAALAEDRGAEAPAAPRWFADVTARSGLDFVHETGASGQLLLPEIMTAGAALFDYDGDGDLDAYLTNGGARSRLFRQDGGGRFTDVTDRSGLGDRGYGMGLAAGDYDNDGDLDVFVTHFGPDRLYRNRGDGTFADATAESGIAVDGWSSSATFFDYDRDGFLDLFVARYVEYDARKQCTDAAGRPDYCSPKVFPPASAVLLHNEGGRRFTDVSRTTGVYAAAGAGLGVVAVDYNDDGWPDLYVANDGSANQLWTNQRDGTFRDDALLLGAAYNLHGVAQAGMGVLAADLDGDLGLDLFVTNLAQETNTLFRNLGATRGFQDVTASSGLVAGSLPLTGFGTVAFDVELDGDLDLVVANGRVTHAKARPESGLGPPWDRFAEPKLLYFNRGDGRFDLAGDDARELTAPLEISRGLAAGDVDNDGDVDLLIANAQSRARLVENQAPRRGHWLVVRALDPRYRRDALGAKLTAVAAGRRWLRVVGAGSSYLSSCDPRAHFGLGAAEALERIEVWWPDGFVESFAGGGVDRSIVLVRGSGKAPS